MRVARLMVALMAFFYLVTWSTGAERNEKAKAPTLDLGGEWSPAHEVAGPSAYKGCLVNRTFATITLTIVRPGFATTYTLPGGAHYRIWLYKGEAVFVAGDPTVSKIMAYEKHNVGGETTVSINPNRLTFLRGVQECLKHSKEKGGK